VSKEVVIIGAGPGGLACALLLARAGLRVRVLERQPFVGGRTSRFTAQGYSFDLGPTFFLFPEVLRGIFQSVGRDLDQYVQLIRLDPQYRLVFGSGGQLDASPDVARMEQEIARLDPGDAANFRRFLSDNARKLERFRPCLEMPFLGWRDVLSWRLIRLLPLLRPWLSLDGELRRYFRDERVRLAFSFQSKYLGMSPFQCPSLFSILAYLEYGHGVFYPLGGCGAVSQAMATVAEELGVQIHLGEEVVGILFRGRRAVGVRTRRGSYPADALVINADFAQAMRRLVPDHLRRRWNDRSIASKRFSCSTFMLYLGLEGTCEQLAHHTIYLSQDYRRNLEDIEVRHCLSQDPSFYVHNPCVTDASLAPRGHSALYVLVPVSHMHPRIDWDRQRQAFAELTLRQLSKVGLPDVQRRIRFQRIVTPQDWEREHQVYRGATFNLAHSLDQMLHLRPRNRFEDLERVYLVGGGTHPGSGLPVIFESAKISSRLILEDLDRSAADVGQGTAGSLAGKEVALTGC
jgi:phytoene desaturase